MTNVRSSFSFSGCFFFNFRRTFRNKPLNFSFCVNWRLVLASARGSQRMFLPRIGALRHLRNRLQPIQPVFIMCPARLRRWLWGGNVQRSEDEANLLVEVLQGRFQPHLVDATQVQQCSK
jgi:hypothetical protein